MIAAIFEVEDEQSDAEEDNNKLYKQYAVNYMHVGILYANVFTELCSINETSAFRIMTII